VTPERVALGIAVCEGGEVLYQAARLLSREDPEAAPNVLDALTARETLGTTALGRGCAIPHARIDDLEHAVAAYLRTAGPVPFDAPDGRGVTDFFVLLVPHDANERHLEMLAAAAERFGDRHFVDALGRCTTPGDVVALFDR
jgi:PTS system nitrogen regulatory IIA component